MDPAKAFHVRGRPAPMSGAERQRRFRERHPDYYRRLHAERRAAVKALRAARRAAEVAALEAARREPLMLPAPVEEILIPGLNAIPATMPAREAVAVAREH